MCTADQSHSEAREPTWMLSPGAVHWPNACHAHLIHAQRGGADSVKKIPPNFHSNVTLAVTPIWTRLHLEAILWSDTGDC